MFSTSCVVVTASAVSNVVAPSRMTKTMICSPVARGTHVSQMCPLEVHSFCFLMVLALLLGKLRTHFGFCQISRRQISASEARGF